MRDFYKELNDILQKNQNDDIKNRYIRIKMLEDEHKQCLESLYFLSEIPRVHIHLGKIYLIFRLSSNKLAIINDNEINYTKLLYILLDECNIFTKEEAEKIFNYFLDY